jgi:hypothetical protein
MDFDGWQRMNIIGIEKIVYGVTDMAAGSRYLTDWGFRPLASSPSAADFATAEQTVVSLRAHDDVLLPPLHHHSAFFTGSCGREVIWGVDSATTLQAVGADLRRDREVTEDAEGTLHFSDDAGNAVGFCVTRRVPVIEQPLAFNLVGAPVRINKPADGAQKNMLARPLRINHVVYLATSSEQARAGARFYTERLGFKLSDNVGDNGFFMRAGGSHDHHNLLFESHGPGNYGLQHSAYEFRDFDHIMHRGRYLEAQGWESHNGPGRHTVGSNLTWYFWTPMGGLMELISDMDYLTDEWKPRFIDPKIAGRPIAWTSRPNGEDFRFGVPSK